MARTTASSLLSVALLILTIFSNTAFASTPETVLMQSDFASGTYRIMAPGNYVLGEDIEFEPNPENSFRPYNLFPGQAQYESYPPQPRGFYDLGFYAGITIETCDVVLDFNGHSFRQTEEFLFHQRFFETVLVSDDPFLPFRGTEAFNQLNSACNTIIKNGHIDTTSHIGIGGLGASDVLIKNMKITNFVVSGIQIGGGKNIKIKNVSIADTLQTGNFGEFFRLTSAEFTRTFLAIQCQSLGPAHTISIADEPDPVAICDLLDELNHQIDLVRRYTLYNDSSVVEDPSWPEAEATYIANATQNPPGVTYGIFMQALSSGAFNQFPENQAIETNNVLIKNVAIRNLRNQPVEVIGLREASSGILKNPATDMIRIKDISSDFNPDLASGANYYKGRNLENAILAVILTESFPGSTGGAVFNDDIVDWMSSRPAKTLADALGSNVDNYSIICNADGNGHVHKGLLGIRIDGTYNAKIKRVLVSGLNNSGTIGTTLCGPYEGENRIGYLGADARGVGLFSNVSVDISNLLVKNIKATARVIGIDMKNAQDVVIDKTVISRLRSTSESSADEFPNPAPYACAITGDDATSAAVGRWVRVSKLDALEACPNELSISY